MRPLRDNAFEVMLAGDSEQVTAALPDVIEVQQPRFNPRHDRAQSALTFKQRKASQIFSFQAHEVECVEVRPFSAKKQIVEMTAAVRFETTDLAIKNRAIRFHRMRDFLGELRSRLEDMTVAGREFAPMPVHVRQRTEAIDLGLEDESRMFERLTDAEQAHGADVRHRDGLIISDWAGRFFVDFTSCSPYVRARLIIRNPSDRSERHEIDSLPSGCRVFGGARADMAAAIRRHRRGSANRNAHTFLHAPPPETDNHAIVPVFFATDRNRLGYTPLACGGDRESAKRLHLGRFNVSVPREHQTGQVERPTIWTFWREDPNKHFIIVRGAEQAYDEFYRQVRDVVGKSERKEAFVFVHGFNVTFESAVYRTAQIAYDLGFDGAPILYSWPSLGSPTGYPTDANNSEWTIDRLHWFLEDVAAKSGANYIHVIAHSRGNWPLMQALKTIATEPRNDPRPRFRQIILTAPDVDADNFRLLAQAVKTVGERTTLYASANDEALLLSKKFQGYQRAGDVRPDIVIVPGLDSIDVSAVDTSLLGHSYYGDNTSVISDIARLLSSGLPPDRRCGLQPVGSAQSSYWTFIAHAVCPVIR